MFRIIFFSVFVFFCFSIYAQEKHTISGYITDEQTGESLIGVNVIISETNQGTSSNTYGFYSLTLPAGDFILNFSYLGYQLQSQKVNLNKDISLNIDLSYTSKEIQEVTIQAEENIIEKTQSGVIEVPVEQIKNIPALLGEVDVLKAIQLLPGVQSGGEGTSGFYVRGGGPDQNLVLLDGVPVYNASHLFGFFSVFNADAIKNVRLTKGGFPARYGGRLSSVLEVDMKEGNMKKFEGEGSIGIVGAKLTLQGPIIRDKTSFIISGRRTYIDLIAQPFINRSTDDEVDLDFGFYDLNLKLNHKFSDKDRLFLSAYRGADKYGASTTINDTYESTSFGAGIKWGNITSALRWNHLFSNKLFSNTTLTYSQYASEIYLSSEVDLYEIEERTTSSLNYVSGIKDYGVKVDFDFLPNPNHYIRFGTNYTYHIFSPGSMDLFYAQNDTSIIDTTFDFSERLKTHDNYFYIEDDIKINDQLNINLGLHLTSFIVKGKNYKSIQPRFSSRYLISKNWSVKASYADMKQNIHLLSNTSVGIPTDIWVPSTDSVSSQHSRQVSFTINHNFNNNKYEISLESYYKKMENLISLSEGASIIAFGDWQDKIEINGEGRTYGLELFIQKKKGKTTGWIGYTLGWSYRKFDNINEGRWYPYKYDRRHDFSFVLSHKFNDKVDCGLTWVYGTGNNITMMNARYPEFSSDGDPFSDNREVQFYSSRNNYRMASYHRLDLAFNFRKKKKWGQRTWSLGAYNAYNRKNPYFISIEPDYEYSDDGSYVVNRVARQSSLFPIIPSISYHVKF